MAEYFASGKKHFYEPKANYQANIDAGLLAHVRVEVQRKEEELRKERERQRVKEEEERQINSLIAQIKKIVATLPKYD